jgi:Protein of unknown function (DUF2934)
MADDPNDPSDPFPERDDETEEEARIRRRAYEIWEAAGRPEGREQEHWFAAEHESGLGKNSSASLGTPINPGETIPTVRNSGAIAGGDQNGPPANNPNDNAPKTAGAPGPAPDTSRSLVANRGLEGPRKASTTPRPTRKPLAGS